MDAWNNTIELLTGASKSAPKAWPQERVRTYTLRDDDPFHRIDLESGKPVSIEEMALQALAGGPLHTKGLAMTLKCSITTVSTRMRRLEAQGRVRRNLEGQWLLGGD